jgi:adenylate cyclase
MGINTGYCNVGNFGSAERMDYTIIGAEANLAARLQHMAEPGSIVMSYETYALVKDIVVAHALPPITMKGITREVIPYVVERPTEMTSKEAMVVSEHTAGLDLRLDLTRIDDADVERASSILRNAMDALTRRKAHTANEA